MGPRGLGTGLAQPYGLRNMSARRTSPPLRGAWIVARKELTESLRDRATVIYAFVLPICMYPVLFWAILQGVMVVEGLQDRTETTLGIAAAGVPADEHDTATEGLTHALSPPSEDPDEPAANSLKLIWAQESMDMEQAREWLAEDPEEDTEDAPDRPDAVLFLDPLTILHVSTKSSSNLASKRARRRLESHASALRQEAADRAGLEAADLDPIKTAAKITAPVLLSVGIYDTGLCPLTFGEKLADRIPDCDLRVYHGAGEGGGHEHAQIQLSWLSDKLGIG